MPGVSAYESTFAELEPDLRKDDPVWVHDLRRTGIERFKSLGFPTLREEEWRFTRTRPIAELDFRPAAAASGVTEEDIVSRTFDDSHCHRLVFVNGYANPALSRLSKQ
ncbi:MAG TPA: hypothetical protein VFH33_05315, partial [Candidatus Krumholzibacteria bacterium]|nr:hypothetical protein [Candidatus Krumholzibacteria bacterium]